MAHKKTKNIIISVLLILTFCVFSGCEYLDSLLGDLFEEDINLEGQFAVHFIDVGQGDSILIQTSDNEFMLIDTGEGDQYIKLTDYLEHFGVDKFKYVIFTHPHSDHMGSSDKIVKEYDIETLIMPDAYNDTQVFKRLVAAIENKNIEITPPVPGDIYKLGNAEFMILAPINDEFDNLNNASVVIEMNYGKHNFLFTGDMEKAVETDVIDYCNKNGIELSIDVLKVAHHGSNSSSQQKFLDFIKPSVAVIQCGKGNSYNHPHLQTVDRLEKIGATILRTDLEGDIIIISDGKNLSVKKGGGAIEDLK